MEVASRPAICPHWDCMASSADLHLAGPLQINKHNIKNENTYSNSTNKT